MFLLYAQWEHFDHMACFEEHLKFVQDVAQFLTCNCNVPQNKPCDQNVLTDPRLNTCCGYISNVSYMLSP